MENQFRYKAWANAELLAAIALLDQHQHAEAWRMAVRLLNHTLVVDRIFAAHLTGEEHPFEATNTPDTPSLEQLGQSITDSDRWYIQYAASVNANALNERISFAFTDGDQGCMSRAEMLSHILLHGAYHRGNVGMLLSSCGLDRPSDTFTRFLHLTEPDRRTSGE